jgi:aminomethyltransferase
MTVLADVHDAHGATFAERGGRRFPADYGRPAVAHRAVRNGVGVTETPRGVVVLTGEDRVGFVDDAVSNRIPRTDGHGTYALLLDPQGRIETDMYVFVAADRLLVLTPPGQGEPLAAEWAEKTFIQDVAVADRTGEFAVFGVHGPQATEKVASVFTEGTPDEPLSFVRGSVRREGVTVVRDDGRAGEEGFLVVSSADAAATVFDSLETHGLNAAPFGADTWQSLTLEAGTPLFDTELRGRIPNDLGLRNAVDFEKGCFVGQEVVSRIENRGRAANRLVGLAPAAVPDDGAAVFAGDEPIGEVTRALVSPVREGPIALAVLETAVAEGEAPLSVRVDGEEVPADRERLPFVAGSDASARAPPANAE